MGGWLRLGPQGLVDGCSSRGPVRRWSPWATSFALGFPREGHRLQSGGAVEAQKQSISLPAGQEEHGRKGELLGLEDVRVTMAFERKASRTRFWGCSRRLSLDTPGPPATPTEAPRGPHFFWPLYHHDLQASCRHQTLAVTQRPSAG